MSLVNSMINQIGREIGRDVYRSVKNASLNQRNSSPINQNDKVLAEVNKFELSVYDKTTLKRLANLIEKTSSVSPQTIGFDQVYATIDEKIDFVRENIDSKMLDELDRLDKLNFANYSIALQQHKSWVKTRLDFQENVVANLKDINNKLLFVISGGWQIFWYVVLGFALFKANFSLVGVFEKHQYGLSHNVAGAWVIIVIICLLFSFLFRFLKIGMIAKQNQDERDTYLSVKNYYEKLPK